jgi:hypothetical protein
MLEIKPNCENCAKSLPNQSSDAMICTFECTFCVDCVNTILFNVCPNCGGGFEKRPTRPKALLEKYPSSNTHIIKKLSTDEFAILLKKNQHIIPNLR